MHNELDAIAHSDPDFEHPATVVGAEQHGQAVEVEDSNGFR